MRSACVTAIASVRSQDGMTPGPVLTFLEDVLSSGDRAASGSLLLPSEEDLLKKKQVGAGVDFDLLSNSLTFEC